MKKLLFIAFALTTLSSCINEKYLYKGNTVYSYEPPPGSNLFTAYKLKKGVKVTLTDKVDYFTVQPFDSKIDLTKGENSTASQVSPPAGKAITGWKTDLGSSLYFPETKYATPIVHKLKYFDTKPVIQALVIPLKIRAAVRDSFPQQASTNLNLGLALGWKFTHNVVNSKKNFLGQYANKYSVSAGTFLGAGTADLRKTTTRYPVIKYERVAPAVSTGFFVMFGINNINFGYALGVDNALGPNANSWAYQSKWWQGIIVGLDILK